ncbi:hypothetical protein CHLRE_16g657150v5 [Chlamydomonas reinhardtii]|uniref:Uncharacterized protein n=1 Tax=Chlamydomonas reinhardtii TaxID=3055 RepID=A8J8H9_CHLRE|nr:uncharacterized protein CHLRE_16g657150v5 [Chlamydomonas reinhardtii]PNW71507.1 hypothetical protein CHLRE_16g657150v5 [Chlamydomonas reinhardtii]|eukprot:XP_001697834.1 predicted protein [Chlamydomonas reinhardtii]
MHTIKCNRPCSVASSRAKNLPTHFKLGALPILHSAETALHSAREHGSAPHTRRCGVVRCASEAPAGPHTTVPHHTEVAVLGGRLVVRPITAGEIQAAGVVLTRAFAGSSEAVSLKEVLQDLETQGGAGGAAAATGCFLVARLYPSTSSSGASGSSNVQLPPGQDSRLVATASVSLSAQDMLVRRLPPPNPPPAAAAYISNMAVDPKFRRQGIARALLAACEEVARGAGLREASLHVREADSAARALYDSSGYTVVVKDSWVDTMRHNIRPRLLMKRTL